ncbi:hypothetical protein [Halostagnicola kamekurae]|uniref:DUF354 domain-containing protein n=1 Tax=Halostagnicola kamekurae TaxID=619731 RepID=A0A1I6SSH3_9EURY|nr:hypothetical protein [Halostagnicola kamekurae]SFS79846.1 hypothetical protein SAMN04488556_2879 [Halostagnicola kamekurae]
MNCLFFTNTPAHVHLYKHTIDRLEELGHDVLVFARSDECTEALLRAHELPYVIYGGRGEEKHSLLWELPVQLGRIVRRARKFGPDVIFGIGPYAAYTGLVTRSPAIAVLDSEPSLDHVVARPFVRAFLTPEAFQKDLGENHYRFRGFKESAYLHPDIFEPDPSIRDALGVDPDESFAIVRLNSFNGHHDVGRKGFSLEQRRRLLGELATETTVFVSDEGSNLDLEHLDARPFDLHPAKLHDALSEADLLVADTQTMVTEAALLGTPAIRSNSFVGESDMGNFLELEDEELIYNLSSFDAVLDRSRTLLADESVPEQWERRRDEYVSEMVNLTELLCTVALTFTESARGTTLGDVAEVSG